MRYLIGCAFVVLTTLRVEAVQVPEGPTVVWFMAPARAAEQPAPGEALERMSRVAELYAGATLEFSCLERIHWIRYNAAGRPGDSGKLRSNYVFSRSDEGELSEIRAPRQLRSLDQAENRMAKRRVPLYVTRAYFWTALFHRSRAGTIHYSLGPVKKKDGKLTFRVDFEPVPPIVRDQNDWYGHVVVDAGTYQILHAEGLKAEDHRQRQAMQKLIDSADPLPVRVEAREFSLTEISTEFGEVKNGMRFPSEVRSAHTRYRVRGEPGNRRVREIPIVRTRQRYSDYRFYSVWSSTEVHGHVFGVGLVEPSGTAQQKRPPGAAGDSALEKVAPDSADEQNDPFWAGATEPVPRYEESFDGSPDDLEAIAAWREAGWQIGLDRKRGATWTARVEDGGWHLVNRNESSAIYIQTFDTADGTIEWPTVVRVRVSDIWPKPRNLAAAGLLYRYSSGKRPSYYAFVVTFEGELQLRRRDRSGLRTVWRAPIENFALGRDYELGLTGRGDLIEMTLDGLQVGTWLEEERSISGPSGVVAFGRGHYRFDDFRLHYPASD